jgi:hypothetical protein
VRFLGPLVEKIIVNGIKEGYEKLPEVVRRYKEKHPGKLGKGVPGEGPLQLARRLSRGQSRMYRDPGNGNAVVAPSTATSLTLFPGCARYRTGYFCHE